jgi:hypothetical protein
MYKFFEIGLKDVIPSVVPPRLLVEDKSGAAEPRNLLRKQISPLRSPPLAGSPFGCAQGKLLFGRNDNENLV